MRGGGVAMRKEAWFGVGFRGTACDTPPPTAGKAEQMNPRMTRCERM